MEAPNGRVVSWRRIPTHGVFRMKCSWYALALFAALPFAASANDSLSYDYVEAGYVKTDVGGDADGWGIGGSWAVHPNIHVFGSYVDQNADNAQGLDITQWTLGAGYRHAISDNVDFVGRVAWNSADSKYTADFNGASIEGGVRGAMGKVMEGWVMAGYGDMDHGNGEFYTRLGAQAKFTDHFGVAADVKFISGDTQWFVGPRVRW
jgi:Ax21 family sulfation-dependent quorum factor